MTQSPTLTARATAAGIILGTAAYMSPEQARGKPLDKRTDVWAFGCVLYEMLTGKRAFEGKTVSDTLAAVLKEDPDWSALPEQTPPAIRRILRRCLQRDARLRLHDIADARLDLEELSAAGAASGSSLPSSPFEEKRAVPSPTVASAERTSRERGSKRFLSLYLPWVMAAACAAAAGALALRARTPQAAARGIKAAILPPAGVQLSLNSIASSPLALSPDGDRLAFCAHVGMGADALWIQNVESGEARPLEGTEGAAQPFWSPDGRSIGFFADRKLKRVDAQGGPVVSLANARDGRGGSWNAAGTIIFVPFYTGPVFRVSADGGPATQVTTLDKAVGESTHRYPAFLPDGKRFLYLARGPGAGAGEEPVVWAGSIDGAERKAVLKVASNVAYANGFLLFMRQGILVAQPFDSAALATRGAAIPLAADVRMDERFSRGSFTVSTNGVLAYQTGKLLRRAVLRRYDRSGRVLATLGEPATFYDAGYPTISPDGSRAAVAIQGERGISDVWLVNTRTGVRSRFTLDEIDHTGSSWTPDGSRLAMEGDTPDGSKLFLKAADGSGTVQQLAVRSSTSVAPLSFSPDGRILLFYEETEKTAGDILVLPLDGARTPLPVAATAAQEDNGQFSPNGRFISYNSDATGRDEVYVAAFPRPGDTWQVSQKGGREARWSRDGKELFFFDRDNRLQVAAVDTSGPRFEVRSIGPLFQTPSRGPVFNWRYDVFPDGRSFLICTPTDEDAASPLTLVTEWTRKLKGP